MARTRCSRSPATIRSLVLAASLQSATPPVVPGGKGFAMAEPRGRHPHDAVPLTESCVRAHDPANDRGGRINITTGFDAGLPASGRQDRAARESRRRPGTRSVAASRTGTLPAAVEHNNRLDQRDRRWAQLAHQRDCCVTGGASSGRRRARRTRRPRCRTSRSSWRSPSTLRCSAVRTSPPPAGDAG
jgi:hypothetical protein